MTNLMKITDQISVEVTVDDLQKIEKALVSYKNEIGDVLLKEGMTLKVFASLKFLTRTEKEYVDLKKNLLTRTVIMVPVSSCTGLIIRGGAGILLAYHLGVSMLFPVGALLGTLFGVGVGISMSTLSCINTFDREIKKNGDLYKSQIIDKVFSDFLLEDEILSQYICPLSQDVIIVPARAPDNQIYEFSYIGNWLDTRPEGALGSPLRICDFSAEDLQLDFDILEKIGKRVQDLYYTHIKTLKDNDVIKKNFTYFAEKRNDAYTEIINAYQIVLMSMRMNHHIEKEEYDAESEKMYQLFEKIKIIKI